MKSKMEDRVNRGAAALAEAKETLGDKFGFPQLIFYTDKTQELTARQCEALRNQGWTENGFNCWVWKEHEN